MTVLTIRAHQRFAVRREAAIYRQGRKVGEGLLVELSLGGCRLGGVRLAQSEDWPLAEGEAVVLIAEGAAPFEAYVRWTVNGTLGFRLKRPFRVAELDAMLRHCRMASEVLGRAYGI